MGFLKHLLFWPVTGPMYLAEFSMEKVRGVVKDQLTDVGRVKEALMDLQLSLELGEIDDEEYEREEARLMGELREVRRWREEFGMGTRGGVVQMGGGEPSRAPAEGGDAARGSAPTGERHPEDEAPVVAGGGASLEITLDWDTDDEPAGSPSPSEADAGSPDPADATDATSAADADDLPDEDEPWTDESSHGSGPGSSSS